jgi:hypothetical protein
VLRRRLQRAGHTEQLVGVLARRRDDVAQGHVPGGHGAGLVQDDGVDPAGVLEDLRALDQDAELRAAAGADHQGGRRGQPEGARARDDQDRDRRGEGRGQSGAGADPEPERADGQRHDDRHEDAGDAVGQPLHLGLAVLRLLDQPGHLGELGLGADARRAHDQAATRVDGAAGDRIAGADLDRHRLPGEHRGVDRGGPLDHLAVGSDLLAGSQHEAVADDELVHGHPALGAVAEDRHLLRAELEQGAQRGAGPALGPDLEVPPGEDERRHPGGGLEVDVRAAVAAGDRELERVGHPGDAGRAPEQRVEGPGERRDRAEGHQGVHGGGAVPQVGPGRPVERRTAPHDDRRGQRERQPLPVLELQRRDHRHRDHRHGERQRDQKP